MSKELADRLEQQYASGQISINEVAKQAVAALRVIPEQCAGIALSHIGAGPDGEAYDEACRDIAEAIRVTFVKP